MKHILAAWMRDRPGVLNRVTGLLSRRNFNIDSLQVSASEEPGISRMTFEVSGDDRTLEQVRSQLIKLVDVTRVESFAQETIVKRELALVRVAVGPDERRQVLDLIQVFEATVEDISRTDMLIQIVGREEKIDSLIGLLRDYHLLEMVRTGPVAIVRSTVANVESEPALEPAGDPWQGGGV